MTHAVSSIFSQKSDGNMAFYAGVGKENAKENRLKFFSQNGINIDKAIFVQQTHSDNILFAGKGDFGRGVMSHDGALPDTDAIITNISGGVLCVQVADCVPLLLWEEEGAYIGAVHSGWRGTLKNIVGKTMTRMINEFGVDPQKIHVWIGPAIGGCCMKVDKIIAEPVQKNSFAGLSKDGSHWDIATACRGQLLLMDVPLQNITLSGECTACHSDKYFSYRREGDRAGRMIAGIVAKPN